MYYYTDNLFRSGDLGVMSPARCLCATPVTMLVAAFYVQLDVRELCPRHVSCRAIVSPNPSQLSMEGV